MPSQKQAITAAVLRAVEKVVAQVSKPAVSRVSKPANASRGGVRSILLHSADLEVGDTAGLLKQRIAIRSQTREEPLQIPPHLRIGVLLNQKRRRCVLKMERGQAGLQTRLGRQRLHLIGAVVEAPPARADFQLMD